MGSEEKDQASRFLIPSASKPTFLPQVFYVEKKKNYFIFTPPDPQLSYL